MNGESRRRLATGGSAVRRFGSLAKVGGAAASLAAGL